MLNQFNVENKWYTFTDKIMSVSGELFVDNNVDISGNLSVNGNASFTGTVDAGTLINVSSNTSGGKIYLTEAGYGGYLWGHKYPTQNIDEIFLQTATDKRILRAIDFRTSGNFNQQIFLGEPGSTNQLYFFGVQQNTSDDRLKHQEIDITNGLNLIRQLNPQKYKKTSKKMDADYVGELEDNTWIWESGLIAQDVLKIPDLSYCVKYNSEDDIYFLNYNDIYATNLAATKELDTIVQNQQTEINDLKTENNLLKSKLNEILSEMGKETI